MPFVAAVEDKHPPNQGKPITDEERKSILEEYNTMVAENKEKRDISLFLQKKFGRGRFAIKNILDEGLKKDCGAWNDFQEKSLDLQE